MLGRCTTKLAILQTWVRINCDLNTCKSRSYGMEMYAKNAHVILHFYFPSIKIIFMINVFQGFNNEFSISLFNKPLFGIQITINKS